MTGAILAGGQSRRMGIPKAGILLSDGRPMIEHVLEALAEVCPQVVLVGHGAGWAVPVSERLLHVPDHEPGRGPLGGLVTLLESGLDSGYLVAACDQPRITPALLHRLQAGDPDRIHLFQGPSPDFFAPFPGYYPSGMTDSIRGLLQQDRPSLRALMDRHPPLRIPVSPAEAQLLAGVNSPEQLSELQRLTVLK